MQDARRDVLAIDDGRVFLLAGGATNAQKAAAAEELRAYVTKHVPASERDAALARIEKGPYGRLLIALDAKTGRLQWARPVKDPLAGFFMFRRQNVDPAKLKPIGYKISLEVMLTGRFQNVVEVPYIFEDRSAGQSKLNPGQQMDYLKHLFSLMARTGELKRFLKFCAVGLSGIVVNQGLLWLLTEFGGLQYYISALFAIEASIISNFVLNDYFTFADRRTGKGKSFIVRLLKFNVTCLAGAGIQYGLLLLFTSVFGVYYLISNLIAIAIAFLWNYFMSSWWTWK